MAHSVFHNFRIERILGVGGMSLVLQARDMVLNRPLAIKVLNDAYRNEPERVARFEKECALMARVRHPNVVSVYSAGVAHGQFYIAMELVRGHNVEMMVSPSKPMPPLRALNIVRQVVLGLDAANKAGLLHRDVKPANVLVSPSGQAKVLDFGLSLGKADADQEEIIWATPYYVAPETLMRSHEDVRTDIYALGMTLLFLLHGKETFPEEPRTPDELLSFKRNLPRPNSRRLRIDESYADMIEHMTAYDINMRPIGYEELLKEMDDVLAAQRVFRLAHSYVGRARKRKRLCILAAALLMLGSTFILLPSFLLCPDPIHERVLVEHHNHDSPDIHLLKTAEGVLSHEGAAAAIEPFMRLAKEASDSAMGAWAALVGGFLSEYTKQPQYKEEATVLLHKHLGDDNRVSPAGKQSLKQIALLVKADSEKLTVDEEQQVGIAPWSAFLSVVKMRELVKAEDKVGAEVYRQKAVRLLQSLPKPYDALGTVLSSWQPEAKRPLQPALYQGVEQLDNNQFAQQLHSKAAENEFVEVMHMLDSKLKQVPQNSTVYRQLLTYQEICSLCIEVDNMLQRRFKHFSPTQGKNCSDRLQLLQEMNEPELMREMKVAYILLSTGDVAASLQNSPYSNKIGDSPLPDTSTPFASLWRKWIRELTPYAAQVNCKTLPKELLFASDKGVFPIVHDGNGNLSGAVQGRIVGLHSLGVAVLEQTSDSASKVVYYDSPRIGVLCEVPSETTVWIYAFSSAWQAPIRLEGSQAMRPHVSTGVWKAQILHRDSKRLLLKWQEKSEVELYEKTDEGSYRKL